MALLYTLCDTDLIKASLVKRTKLTPCTRHRRYSTGKKIVLLTLAIVNVILWFFVYEIWPEKEPAVADLSYTSLGSVTGIMYSDEKPSAIMHGKAVYQGDVVDGYEILKIGKREVLFKKDGRTISKEVTVRKTK